MANIELDGPNKKIKVDSGDLTLDVPGDIVRSSCYNRNTSISAF